MKNNETEIRTVFLDLERSLLADSVRTDPACLANLLDSNFTEHAASGTVYTYKNGDTFENMKEKTTITESSFKVVDLADDVKLVLYQTVAKGKNCERHANRSSIWKKNADTWKLVFHQGTICAE